MSKQNQTADKQASKKNNQINKPVSERLGGDMALAEDISGPIALLDQPAIQDQASRLSDPRLSTIQRQMLATRIGQGQGNQHLQRVIAATQQNGQTTTSTNGQHSPTKSTRSKPIVQPKLIVNEPDDQYEQEADSVAEAVLRMPAADTPPDDDDQLDTSSSNPFTAIQMSGDNTPEVTPALETNIDALRGGGDSLSAEDQTFFENRMGADFSDVRIHNNDTAVQTSQDLEARAYTVGSDIAFNDGEYQPGSEEGRHLLAHELTHVVQQGAAGEMSHPAEPAVQRQEEEGEEDDTPTEEEKAAALAEAAWAEQMALASKSEGEGKTAEAKAASESKKAEGEGDKQAAEGGQTAGPVNFNGIKAQEAALAEKSLASQAESKANQEAMESDAETATQTAVDSIEAPAAEKSGEAADVAAETAEAEGAGTGGDIESATDAAKSSVEEAYGAAEDPAGKAPDSPSEDPTYPSVTGGVEAVGQAQQTHPPPKDKADEAQAAVQSPASEITGQAQTGQVGEMEQAESPPFDAVGFKQQLMDRITAMTPQSVEEADDFKAENNLDEAKGEMTGKVEQEREASQGPLEEKSAESPDTGSVEPKAVTPLEPVDPGSPPAEIGADAAVPKPKSPAEFEQPLQEGTRSADDQMKDAELTDEQLENSNEPEFQSALESKNEAKAQAEQSSEEYRAFEQEQLSQAEEDAVSTAQEALQGMQDQRVSSVNEVGEEQNQTRSQDEQARAQVATDINAIYERTKTSVETILSGLDGEVEQAFDTGAEEARQAFEDYVSSRMNAYKQRRYGGMFGWAKWLKDKVLGMPSEVNVFYTDGRNQYLKKMDAVIDNVVSIIGTTLTKAKAEITQGKQEIQQYIEQLPEDLKAVGEEAAQSVESKFEALEQSIADKQNELIDTLANKYQENLEAVDARIEELKAANRGLVDKLIDAIAGIIKVILKLKDLLMNVLSGIADAVSAIIDDPIGFIGNLIDAVVTGLNNFVSNIADHLQEGFVEWLTGNLGDAGIQMPDDIFSIEGVLDLVLQIFGITWDNFRSRAVGIFGETVVSALETGFELFILIKDEGLIGVWDLIQEKLADLQDQVIEGIKEMLISEVIEAGIKWIIGLVGGPAGAFVKACMAIYDIVIWFVNNADRLASLITSVTDAISAIAAGSLSAAADYVENALADFIPTAIGFLASLLSLGDLSKKVRKIIDKVQAPVNEAIDYLLNMIKGFVGKIAKAIGFEDGGAESPDGEIGKEVEFAAGDESHKIWVDANGSTAKLMWAADGEKPLDDKLAEVATNVGQMTGEQQGEAQGLLAQAQSLEGQASEKAQNLAAKMNEVKTMDDGDTLGTEQTGLEADEDQLAQVLAQLFEMAGGGDIEESLKNLHELENERANEGRGVSREEADIIAQTIKEQNSIIDEISVVDGAQKWNYEYVVAREVEEGQRPKELPETQVENDGGDKAEKVVAEPLTKIPGNTTGSSPSANIPGWEHAQALNQAKDEWVRLHLLSEKLHGPGTAWNLTPGRKSVNSEMEGGPESDAKTRIGNEEILYYEVNVSYQDADPDFPEKEFFPSNISVSWGAVEQNGDQFTRVGGESWGSGFIQPPPKETGVVTVNLNEDGRVNLARFAGISDYLATKIVEERAENGDFTLDDFEGRMKSRCPQKFDVEWPAMTLALLDEDIDIKI